MSEQTWNNQILYKPHSSGELGTWRICVSLCVGEGRDGQAVYISYAAKVIGGKEKETPTFVTAGKQGRSPLEQAFAEAESKFKTKLRKGYSIEKPEVGSKPKNTLGFNIAVKAQKFHEVTHEPPYLISPKLDGHHMSAGVRDGQVVLYSMNSKELDIEHIQLDLQARYDDADDIWDGTEIDGELYKHGLELDEIKSRIKKSHPEHGLLEFHIYDAMYHKECYAKRFSVVSRLVGMSLMDVETYKVWTPEEIQKHHDRWIGLGYEGTMVRWGSAGYADSARSKYILKKKDYIDDEATVIGWELGKPKFKDGQQYERPILRLMSKKGMEFGCGLHGTMVETHQAYLDDLDKKIGQEYTFKFFKYNKSGAPSQPTGLRFRNDI